MATKHINPFQEETTNNGRVHLRRVDYDELAKRCGQKAWQRAKQNGLSDEEANEFRMIFGTPIAPEWRLS